VTQTLRLAHRGDWRNAPENSLAAMQAALAIPGCDGLEFDVRASSDGVPILLHDPSLDVELKELVPAAVDVLEIERGRVDDEGRPELRNAVISSFDAAILRWFRETRPTWPRWLNAHFLTPSTIERATDLGCVAISVRWKALDVASVARVREAGLDLVAWTVRDLDDYRWIASMGVVAICAEDAALDG
jgi:glycerophosphoryl diester phosphodiesterase